MMIDRNLPFEDTPRGQADADEQFEASVTLIVDHVVDMARELPKPADRKRYIAEVIERLKPRAKHVPNRNYLKEELTA